MSASNTIHLKLEKVCSDPAEAQLDSLYKQQKDCERARKYMQADIIKKQILGLRSRQGLFVRKNMREQQQEERTAIQKVHQTELGKFNAVWDSTFREFKKLAEEMQSELVRRHQGQMEMFQKELTHQLSSRFKESSQLLTLRRTQQTLAKREEYLQALQTKKLIDQLSRSEQSKYQQQLQRKLKQHLLILKNKQDLESNSLNQKIAQSFQEKKKQKQQQLSKLMQKYANVTAELDSQHSQERGKVGRGGMRGSGVGMKSTSTFR